MVPIDYENALVKHLQKLWRVFVVQLYVEGQYKTQV